MRKLFLTAAFLFLTGVLFGSHPLTVVSWDAFVGADSYEVAVVDLSNDMNVGGTALVPILTVTAPTTSFELKDIMGTLPEATYRLQVRSKVGQYFTDWTNPQNFVWDTSVPGVVQNVTFTD